MENGHRKVTQYLSYIDVMLIVAHYEKEYSKNVTLKDYKIRAADDELLGFLSDYWKLKIKVEENCETKTLHFFLKAISRSNESRASIAKEWKVFDKEIYYYSFLKSCNITTGLKSWNAKLITALDKDVLVFEDLAELGYRTRDKLDRFDMNHTLQALRTLANFHASSLIFEENKRIQNQKRYNISDEFELFLDVGGYRMSDQWYSQCMIAALDVIEAHSKYGKDKTTFALIKEHWCSIWSDALEINNFSEHKNVLCHRDLWNNNIMFRYKDSKLDPKDCLFVDFQGTRYQPLAGDITVLLYCNLDPKFREENMTLFLDFYYDELNAALSHNSLIIDKVMPKLTFLKSVEVFRKWGLIVNACLIPQNCLDDEMMAEHFSDTNMFQDILTRNKTKFISNLINQNRYDYKRKILEVFEEIVERYILTIV